MIMKHTVGSSAPSYIFHNQRKTLNTIFVDIIYDSDMYFNYDWHLDMLSRDKDNEHDTLDTQEGSRYF